MNEKELSERLQAIEEVLKLLMVNSVLNGTEIDRLRRETLDKARERLAPFGYNSLRLNYIEDQYYIFADADSSESASTIRKKYFSALDALGDNKFVLVFDKLNGKTKKAIEDSEVSFCLVGKMLKIFEANK